MFEALLAELRRLNEGIADLNKLLRQAQPTQSTEKTTPKSAGKSKAGKAKGG